jgi:1-acyl-sn-glycerol-3-phosphate acyltransferase
MNVYTVARTTLAPLLRLIFGVKRSGENNLPLAGGVIVCCNHRSNYDAIILGASLKRNLNYMAKAELFKNPIVRGIVTAFGAFPVRRGRGDSEAIRKAINIVNAGNALAMFPEGKRHKEGGIPQRFKSGTALVAFKTHATILPAAIVTKGAVRPFKRNFVKVGKPLSYEELGFTDGGTENLHAVSDMLHDKVVELINS